MKALAVIPGTPGSIHLRDVPTPGLDEVAGGRGVRVRVLRVGVDGTDKEINQAEYGTAPAGSDYLIIGHESFECGRGGRGEGLGGAARRRHGGDRAPSRRLVLRSDRAAGRHHRRRVLRARHQPAPRLSRRGLRRVARLPGQGAARLPRVRRAARADVDRREGDRASVRDPAADQGVAAAAGRGHGRGDARPARHHDPAAAWSGDHHLRPPHLAPLVFPGHRRHHPAPRRCPGTVPQCGADRGDRRPLRVDRRAAARAGGGGGGGFDLVFEATGNSSIVFQAAAALAKNGVLVLTSITGGGKTLEIPADRINLEFVLGNKVMFGTVNAHRDHFELGASDLAKGAAEYPGWLDRLLTHRVEGLENYGEMMRLLTEAKDAIKVYVQVGSENGA